MTSEVQFHLKYGSASWNLARGSAPLFEVFDMPAAFGPRRGDAQHQPDKTRSGRRRLPGSLNARRCSHRVTWTRTRSDGVFGPACGSRRRAYERAQAEHAADGRDDEQLYVQTRTGIRSASNGQRIAEPPPPDPGARRRRGVGGVAARPPRADRRGDRPVQRRRPAARYPLALRRQRQRPAHARARGRLRAEGPSRRPAPARLSRARLQLAQGDGADRRRRLSRDRARRARLRPDVGDRRALRRRPGAVPHAEPGARHAGAGLGVRLSLGRRGDRSRSGIAARGLVRARAPRRLPVGDDDERAVRRSAGAAVRHRGRAGAPRPPRRPTRSTTSSPR